MNKNSLIYVAGHKGLVGSSLVRQLKRKGYENILVRSRQETDLLDQSQVRRLFAEAPIEYVFLAAAKVGGIIANQTQQGAFTYENLSISINVIDAAKNAGVKKLLNLGSSCIYPRSSPQPIKEEYLLTGPLEPTNEGYAIAKIGALKLCRYYNEQYGTDFFSVMPTNLYGPGDSYDLTYSHVLPAMIRKFHLGKLLSKGEGSAVRQNMERWGNDFESIESLMQYGIEADRITLWGSGQPRREFLYVDDLAEACIMLMERCHCSEIGEVINIGCGQDVTIAALAEMVKKITGFEGTVCWDTSKPDGMPRKLLDVSRISQLGWRPKIALFDGVRKSYHWYLSPSEPCLSGCTGQVRRKGGEGVKSNH